MLYAQNPLDTFPRNFPADGESCQLVADLLATRQMACQDVANKSATSWQQVVVNWILETTRHNRHNGLFPVLLTRTWASRPRTWHQNTFKDRFRLWGAREHKTKKK